MKPKEFIKNAFEVDDNAYEKLAKAFNKISRNVNLKRMFTLPENAYRKQKLQYEFIKILNDPAALRKMTKPEFYMDLDMSHTPTKRKRLELEKQVSPIDQAMAQQKGKFKEAYTKRMALGDKLTETKGDEKKVQQNQHILEDMDQGLAQMKEAKQKMRDLAVNGLDENVYLVEHNGERYTRNGLLELSDLAFKDLRERVYQTKFQASKRALNKKTKESTRRTNAEKAAIKTEELKIIDELKRERDGSGQ